MIRLQEIINLYNTSKKPKLVSSQEINAFFINQVKYTLTNMCSQLNSSKLELQVINER